MRRRDLLNGEWDFAPDFQGREPAVALAAARWAEQKVSVPSSWRWSIAPGLPFQPYDLFGYPAEWNDAASGVLRRTFPVVQPASVSGGGARVFLIVKGTLQRSAVFVNGTLAAESEESFLPLEVDVTDLVHTGDNELAVWCGPFSSRETPAGGRLLAPNGSWFAQMARGLWQDVMLEYRPAVFIADASILTLVRAGEIQVDVSVCNAAARPARGKVRIEILDAETPVMRWEEGGAEADPGKTLTLHTRHGWKDPMLWSPENPHLYTARVSWAEDGAGDVRDYRFGFREAWLEGHRFFLNGVPVFLRGDAWHYQGFLMQSARYARAWYAMCRATGINVVRLHAMPYPECFLDAADETGMLIIDESAIYGSSKLIQSDDPAFIERCRAHLRGLVRRDRNRPSVVIWSMQNEMRWVDGRDGWRKAMPSLVRAMRELDPVRPISFDGDNRLVDPREAEILSMHYTIDGTVAQWSREKPLIFGEHGAWHYVSPQTCAGFAGQKAYTDFGACMDAIGLQERLFIEYARWHEVTGVTPFNIVNYAMEAMPSVDVTVQGPQPLRIPALSLTLNDGRLPDEPLFRPNPSWRHVRDAFAPVTVITNQHDRSFYGSAEAARTWRVLNDTMHSAEVTFAWRLTDDGGTVLERGDECFSQAPAVPRELGRAFVLPDTAARAGFTLRLDLIHGDTVKRTLVEKLSVHPSSLLTDTLPGGEGTGFVGAADSFALVARLLPGLRHLAGLSAGALTGLKLLIIGPDFTGSAPAAQDALRTWVSDGGFLLVLDQSVFTPGDIPLTARTFHRAFMTDPAHPVFTGLSDEDLDAWHPGNPWDPSTPGIVRHVFVKPSRGDARVLLECAEGDFGWGGLLWSPLLDMTVGKGRVVLCQLELLSAMRRVPAACILLRNLLAWGCADSHPPGRALRLVAPEGSSLLALVGGLDVQPDPPGAAGEAPLFLVDPEALLTADGSLAAAIHSGAQVLIVAAEPRHARLLEALAHVPVRFLEAPAWQVKALPDPATRGVSQADLSLIDKVTYSPPTETNTLMARFSVDAPGSTPFLSGVQAPWVDFFIRGLDAEYLKTAVATRALASPDPLPSYGIRIAVGKGALLISQVLPLAESDKVRRFYARLLANLGASFRSSFLDRLPDASSLGFDAFMAIAREPYQDERTMLSYFTDPRYSLNNLGEGVFGWMKRIEARGGEIRVPDSAGKTWFLTAFMVSEANRDPESRPSPELPDPGIMPDMYLRSSCPLRVFLNGAQIADHATPPPGVVKVEDAALREGVNRVVLVCDGRSAQVRVAAWFLTKHGEPVSGLRTALTLD